MEMLWQSNEFVDDNTLTVNVNRLRKRMESIGWKNSDSDQTRTGVYGMTVAEYIRDYKMNFIFHILFLVILTAILMTMRLDTFAVIYIVLIGVLLANGRGSLCITSAK